MLVAIGYRVELKLKTGRVVRPRGVLFYDFSGKEWPKTSVLVGNRPEGHPSRPGRSKWFGKGYEVLETRPYEIIPGAKTELLKLKNWRFVGPIVKINYERGLEHPERADGPPAETPSVTEPRGDYTHDFDREAPPGLFQRGKYYRIELLPGTKLTVRGFVEPGQ